MKALPSYVIDLIRDGVPPAELRNRGERGVWAALLRTAASALQRGWTRQEWSALVSEPGSHLGTQARLKRGTKPRTEVDFARQLDKAWTKAETWIAERPATFNKAAILDAILAVRERVEHPDADLSDVDRQVLLAACTIAQRNGTTRPALPRRGVMAETGLPERAVRSALDDLDSRGLLRLEVRGRSHATQGRANLYRLPDPEAIRIPVPVNGSVGRPPQVYGTREIADVGTPEQIYGTATTPEETNVQQTVTVDGVTITASPGALAEFLREIGRTEVPVSPNGDTASDDVSKSAQVVPLRGRRVS